MSGAFNEMRRSGDYLKLDQQHVYKIYLIVRTSSMVTDNALFSVNREQPGSASHSTDQRWRIGGRHVFGRIR